MEVRLLRNLEGKEKYKIAYYIRTKRIKTFDTENGRAFDNDEYKKILMTKKNINLEGIKYITNEDLKNAPYIEVRDKSGYDGAVIMNAWRNKQPKYFNTDTDRICYYAFDILYREIENIVEKTGLTKEEVIDALTKKYQEKQKGV